MDDRTLLHTITLVAVLALAANLLVVREVGLARERARSQAGPPSNADVRCAICEYSVSMVYDYIEEVHTEEMIEDMLYKACDLLPPDLLDECRSLVDEHKAVMIELVEQKIPTKYLCQILEECPRQG